MARISTGGAIGLQGPSSFRVELHRGHESPSSQHSDHPDPVASEHKTDMAPDSEFLGQKRTTQGSLSLYAMIYVLDGDHSTQRASLEVHLQGMGSLESSLKFSQCISKLHRSVALLSKGSTGTVVFLHSPLELSMHH